MTKRLLVEQQDYRDVQLTVLQIELFHCIKRNITSLASLYFVNRLSDWNFYFVFDAEIEREVLYVVYS